MSLKKLGKSNKLLGLDKTRSQLIKMTFESILKSPKPVAYNIDLKRYFLLNTWKPVPIEDFANPIVQYKNTV